MSRQTVCDQCGRSQPEDETWWVLTKFSFAAPQDNASFDLCSDACLAAWSAGRQGAS